MGAFGHRKGSAMRFQLRARLLFLAFAWAAGDEVARAAESATTSDGFTFHAPPGERSAAVAAIAAGVGQERKRIAVFFGHPFPHAFAVRVFATRSELDAHWRAAWKMPDLTTECWMVASGTASELVMLSPDAWAKEACDHDAAHPAHLAGLLAHELTHVYHAQHNPKPDFDGLDAIAWFAEGLAVYASGQLEEGHQATAEEALARGLAPTALAAAWTGRYRYGVSGSLVRFVDRRVGRRELFAMLSATTDAELLARLGLSEAELLAAWRAATGPTTK